MGVYAIESKKVYEVVPIALQFGANRLKATPSGWEQYTCPVCGDTKGHLYVNPNSQVFRCFKCGVRGRGGVTFLQLAGGIGDWNQALRELRDGSFGPAICVEPRNIPPSRILAAPPERRDRVYRAFTGLLPLYPEHLENLRQRGLPDELIQQRYRSVPRENVERWSICRQLVREGYDLDRVPGFYVRESRSGGLYWDFSCYGAGIFIPMIGVSGLIQGFKIRIDAAGKKRYRTFSSAGLPSGASPGAPVHVSIPIGGASFERVWVTEGELKADVAAHLLSRVFISVPGVTVWREVKEVLHAFGAHEAVIAFDADQATNRDVENAKDGLAADLAPNFRVFDCRWDGHMGKGIDEALVFFRKERDIDELEFITGESNVSNTVSTAEISVASAL
jgi:hypothetical protein